MSQFHLSCGIYGLFGVRREECSTWYMCHTTMPEISFSSKLYLPSSSKGKVFCMSQQLSLLHLLPFFQVHNNCTENNDCLSSVSLSSQVTLIIINFEALKRNPLPMDILRQQLPQLGVSELLELLQAIVSEIQSRIFILPTAPHGI